MSPSTDIRLLDAKAVRAAVEATAKATVQDLGRPTPCSEWTLGDLLAHMTAQHRGFAAAARGRGGDREAWQVRPLGGDAVAAHAEAAEQVIAAFAEEGVLGREFMLAGFGPLGTAFPASTAISFHFIDYVVHGWDVARALGSGYDLDPELLAPALRVAGLVPGDAARLAPGAAFRPALQAAGCETGLDRILALLGRSPRWPE